MLQLPDLVLFSGDWEEYENILYDFFKKDFLKTRPLFEKRIPVGIKKEPKFKNKEATFWHIITWGKIENQRLPDLRKCEKIRWVRPVIESVPHQDIRLWLDRRGRDERICLCYGDWEYVVVCKNMKKYILLITAYPVDRMQTKQQLQSQYNDYIRRYKKTNTAFGGGIVTPSTHGG